ncbi:hypothetical protein XENOCAPTIV_028716 [Xenoophorus captivus]|uniref:Reverse transcriptase RNase H-like domain-containing protein n=1 Tax=Xenoophorus captivus TaxID=1517983 RepID=A0ABV0RSI2_9TELE
MPPHVVVGLQPTTSHWCNVFEGHDNLKFLIRKQQELFMLNLGCRGEKLNIAFQLSSLTVIDTNATITRWYLSLQPFRFQVHYRPGHKNVIADFLSRDSEE